ncbi:MAG: rRNA pseudouridine synthase [Chthonomonas sp.]|nr:rRNA pseudouridine synthase [Chthonomonas sp.]
MSTPETERLHKFLARCGVASRRKAEELIREGAVEVNGSMVIEMGVRVGPEDEVRVFGRPVVAERFLYVVMNKPKGYVTTTSDERNRRTVMDLLPDMSVSLKPVGRLDLDTEGVLLFTNDGELAARLTHARYAVDKEYLVKIHGVMPPEKLAKLRAGVWIEGGKTKPIQAELVHQSDKETVLRLTLHEGRNRQIRRMCEALGHDVMSLKRERIAFISVKGMALGECRTVGQKDIQRLRAMVKLQ